MTTKLLSTHKSNVPPRYRGVVWGVFIASDDALYVGSAVAWPGYIDYFGDDLIAGPYLTKRKALYAFNDLRKQLRYGKRTLEFAISGARYLADRFRLPLYQAEVERLCHEQHDPFWQDDFGNFRIPESQIMFAQQLVEILT